jgi:toxin ParE1/3/4
MAFRVEIAEGAQRDAEGILDWLIAEQAGQAGLRWFEGLQKAIATLADLPTRCPLAPESTASPVAVRQLLYGHKPHVYRVLFTIDGDAVVILHIWHGRRRPATAQ